MSFLEVLREQEARYGELVAMAKEQKALISEGRIEELFALVDRKRSVMAELDRLEKEVSPVRERWSELRPRIDEATARRIESAFLETKRVLQDLIRLEDEALGARAGAPIAALRGKSAYRIQ